MNDNNKKKIKFDIIEAENTIYLGCIVGSIKCESTSCATFMHISGTTAAGTVFNANYKVDYILSPAHQKVYQALLELSSVGTVKLDKRTLERELLN